MTGPELFGLENKIMCFPLSSPLPGPSLSLSCIHICSNCRKYLAACPPCLSKYHTVRRSLSAPVGRACCLPVTRPSLPADTFNGPPPPADLRAQKQQMSAASLLPPVSTATPRGTDKTLGLSRGSSTAVLWSLFATSIVGKF